MISISLLPYHPTVLPPKVELVDIIQYSHCYCHNNGNGTKCAECPLLERLPAFDRQQAFTTEACCIVFMVMVMMMVVVMVMFFFCHFYLDIFISDTLEFRPLGTVSHWSYNDFL